MMSLRGENMWASFFPVITKIPLLDAAMSILPSFLSVMLLINDMTDSPAEFTSLTSWNLSLL